MDICQCDVSHCGGISELRRIASYAEIYDIGMAPHCPNGPLSFSATLQLGFAVPNFIIAEMSWQVSEQLPPHSDALRSGRVRPHDVSEES
jgi:galactonate dehydratase